MNTSTQNINQWANPSNNDQKEKLNILLNFSNDQLNFGRHFSNRANATDWQIYEQYVPITIDQYDL